MKLLTILLAPMLGDLTDDLGGSFAENLVGVAGVFIFFYILFRILKWAGDGYKGD